MERKHFTLPNGLEVMLCQVWNCCDGTNDCDSEVEVYNSNGSFIFSLKNVSIPDRDDYDTTEEYRVAMCDFLAFIEEECEYWDMSC